ncbi:MAG: hypothetical protein HY909_17720 [Deltaproteobacteria bacterium]|nr:hypothetical protein [Deltaproteobacteria bacterium]
MTALRRQLERWIDETLDGITRAPMMYGGPEAIELQALLLLQLRAFVAHPNAVVPEARGVFDAWAGEVRRRHPGHGPVLLHAVLAAGGHDEAEQAAELARQLAVFREAMVRDLQPENPFSVHDLALAVRMRKGRPLLPTARIGALYGLVGQVLRSVARQGARRGRLPRELESAITVRPAAGFEIVPENGIGAQVILPMVWPRSQQVALPGAQTADDVVREAFKRFVSVATWASEREPIERLVQAVPESAARTRMALDLMRLLPPMHGDIEAVEIGGRVIERDLPVSLHPEARERLVEVIERDLRPTPFDGTGTLRMLDLDEGRLRLRQEGGGTGHSLEVWLTSAEATEDAAALLGKEVRVEGKKFVRFGGSAFVVAARVEAQGDDDPTEGELEGAR